MPPGTAFVHDMDQAVQTTRHTMLVLSPAYLRSAMADPVAARVVADPSGDRAAAAAGAGRGLRAEGLLADRVYIDLVGLDEATTRATLPDEVARALRGSGRPATRPRFPEAASGSGLAGPVPDRAATGLERALPAQPTFTGRERAWPGWPPRSSRGGGGGHPGAPRGRWGWARPPWRPSTPTDTAPVRHRLVDPRRGAQPPWSATTPTSPSRWACRRPARPTSRWPRQQSVAGWTTMTAGC